MRDECVSAAPRGVQAVLRVLCPSLAAPAKGCVQNSCLPSPKSVPPGLHGCTQQWPPSPPPCPEDQEWGGPVESCDEGKSTPAASPSLNGQSKNDPRHTGIQIQFCIRLTDTTNGAGVTAVGFAAPYLQLGVPGRWPQLQRETRSDAHC